MILPYIVNVALILGACLAFYKILLRRETFYRVNRYMLIVCLVISFALPLLPVPQQFSLRKQQKETTTVVQNPVTINKEQAVTVPVTPIKPDVQSPIISSDPANANSESFSFAQLLNWLFWIYWFGVIVFAGSFLFQVALLLYRAWRNPVIIDGRYRIVEVSGDKAPCSFGNIIYINPAKYEWETYNQILLHEKIHIQQKHTVDIIVAELVLIFQWFNPFAWLYRREIESNLEFLTDDQLMQLKEVDKKAYQLSLVKVSAPHFPLSLTTNYNQSILKKRIVMMNAKKSNLHTAWKYFFLLPVLAILISLLNEPVAKSQMSITKTEKHENTIREHDIETEGSWFATIKNEKVSIQFKSDGDKENDHSFNSTTFKLTDLSPAPTEGKVTFKITRDAGSIEFTGRFEGNTGMGQYKFAGDKAYGDYMSGELKGKLDERDQLVFFFIDVKKGFVPILKGEGYKDFDKDDIIPVVALGIDQAYIRSLKNAGFKDVSLEDLVTLKAMNIDEKYAAEIRSAGYKDITTDQLVTFKAQGIDKEYISKVRNAKGNTNGNANDANDANGANGANGANDADDIVTFKAMNITEDFIKSFKAVGLNNISNDDLVSFKAVGVTPEFVKGWHAAGFKNIEPDAFIGMKAQNVTAEYLKTFTDIGYKVIKPEELVTFKALNITPEYIKSFEAIGYKNIDTDELPALKSMNITPEFIKGFEAVGYTNIPLDEIVSVKAVGVTPEYVKDMKSKGFNYKTLQKYITLKSID